MKSGLQQIADRYDAFLIDQFGVLRDGRGPYRHAAATLSALKAAGKHTIILSNSGKRAKENAARLVALGFAERSWDTFLTSGEVAFRIMERDIAGRKNACSSAATAIPRRSMVSGWSAPATRKTPTSS